MQLSGVRLSVPCAHHMLHLQVCCCGPGKQDITIDCFVAGGPQPDTRRQMQAVPRCKPRHEAEHNSWLCDRKAKRCYQKAFELDAENPVAGGGLVQVMLTLGEHVAARDCLQSVVDNKSSLR